MRKNIEGLIYLLPVTWMLTGVGFFLAVRAVPAGFRIAGATLSLAVSLALVQRLARQTSALRALPRLDVLSLLAVGPWIVANTRQLLPFWNDAANYVHSAHHLFAGSASLAQVMATAGPQDVVQGDFHGPGYVFLHWPIGVFSADSLSFMGSAMLAYSPVRLFQAVSVLLMFQALRGAWGSAFALATTYATFFFPWTNELLSGTHREWVVLYAVTLLILLFQHDKPTSPVLIFAAAVVFAQSHITTVLMLPALALFLAWPTAGSSKSAAHSSQGLMSLVTGLAIGYAPLLMRAASGKVSGSASYDELMVVAPQAMELFDASRSRSFVFGRGSLPLPPIPLSALVIVLAGIAASIWILRLVPQSRHRSAAAGFLTYCLTFCLAFVGGIDRVIDAAGLSASWFSLAKLLGANQRYWFAVVMSSLIMLGLALREADIVAWLRSSASVILVLVTGLSLIGVPVLVTVLHSGAGPISQVLLPGRNQWPVSGYLQSLEPFQRPALAALLVGVVLSVVARLFDGPANSRIGTVRGQDQQFLRRKVSAEAVALFGLAAVLLAAPVAFAHDRMTYGRGTTASTAAVVDFWNGVLTSVELDENCSFASSSSTTQAFFNRSGTPHYNLNAGWAAALWQTPAEASSSYLENAPCILFPGGFIDFTPKDALWRSLYSEAVCGPLGFCMHIDPQRVIMPAQPRALLAGNFDHDTQIE